MINPRKLVLYTLTPILAYSMLGSVGFASHKKKKKKEATTAAASTQATGTTAAPSVAKPAPKSEQMKNARTAPATRTSTASAGDIASAKAKGMVWVNTESKKYHTGGKYYGNTKHGQFMSVADAQKAGYQASKR